MVLLAMTLGDMQKRSIAYLLDNNIMKSIKHPYYYVPLEDGSDYNFFHIISQGMGRSGKCVIDPIEFTEVLIELSTKVKVGNNFTDIGKCLKLPWNLQRRAEKLDEQLAKMCFR